MVNVNGEKDIGKETNESLADSLRDEISKAVLKENASADDKPLSEPKADKPPQERKQKASEMKSNDSDKPPVKDKPSTTSVDDEADDKVEADDQAGIAPESKEDAKSDEKNYLKSDDKDESSANESSSELKVPAKQTLGRGKRARIPNKRYSDFPLKTSRSHNAEAMEVDLDKSKALENGEAKENIESGSNSDLTLKEDTSENSSSSSPNVTSLKASRVSHTSSPSTPATKKPKPTVDLTNPNYLKPFQYGWKRELVYRATSNNSTKRNGDIYYYTPSGMKVRSMREVSKTLKNKELTLDDFTFFKEPLGLDDPEKEIIRDAKRKSSASTPAAKKGTPKLVKTPKTASPKVIATPGSPPDSSKSKNSLRLGGFKLKEKGASVSKAIRQLQGEPVVQLQHDFAMHNRQEHRNDYAGYSDYTWHAGNKNPVRGRPQSQRGRIPTVTSTVTSETSRQSRTRILVDCDRNKPTIEEAPSPPGEDCQRLLCTNKEVVPEKSDISEIVAPSSVKDATATSKEPDTLIQPDEPSTAGNINTSLNTRLLPSLDPLCNPEFNEIVANLENCIASSAKVTRKEETKTSKDGNVDTPGVVELEVVIASYPEEATMRTDEIGDSREEVPMDCVDSDTETVYFEESVVYDNDNMNTSSTFLNYKEPIQTAVDTSPCQSSNISIKRKSENSSASKIKISKSSDNEKTESINNVNDKLSTDTAAKYLQVTHSKVVSEGNDEKESSRHSEVIHQQKGKTVVDGTVCSEKPQHVVKKCRITKRRKTVHNTLSEQSESNHNNREKRCKSEETDNRNLCRSEEGDPSLICITRSKGHEFGLGCKSLPVNFREHSKPTKSKHPRSSRTTQNSQSCKTPKKRRYRIIRDSSSDEESDMSAVSYNSSASEKRHKRRKRSSKPKVAAAIPAKTVDPKLQKPQVSASSHIRSSEPIYNNTSHQIFHKNVSTLDKKRNLVRLNEYQRTESFEKSSNVRSPPSQMDILFGPHSDNEEMTIMWSPKPENLIWSPKLDDSDSPDCIFKFDEDAINSSSVSTSKSCKEKTEENIPKKVPWDHGLRTVCADSDDKKESKKTHHRVSLIQGDECSKKVDSRRASLSHNLTGKQESEKSINGHRRFSLGHDKALIAERRCSLTPITNILPRNDKTNANKDDARTPAGVSGNHANNIQNIQHRPSVTQNNSENKAEHKKLSNSLNGINKKNVTKIVDRRSSISHTSTADVKQDKKTLPVPISNKLETNNEQKKPVFQKSLAVENKKENKKPAMKQRQLSIDLKHATINHLQGLTWEIIMHLEHVHPELKSARQCQQPRKVKPNSVVLMPVVPVYDKFTTVKQPRRTATNDVDSQPGSSAEPNVESNRDVIDLCDSDDEQIIDIKSINSLMRTILGEKPILELNVTCSDAAAPSNEVASKPEATTRTEFGIQHSAVGAFGINVTPTEIPVTIQCSRAMASTSSCVPPIVMKENRNKTRTELGIQHPAGGASRINVTTEATTPTELGIQHPAVGVSTVNGTPTEIQYSTATASTSLSVPPTVMKQSHNEAPTELGIQHSAQVGASSVNVTPTEIPDTMQCSTSIVPTDSGLPPIGIEETRNKDASTNVQNMQQDMPHLTITLVNPRSAADASNVPTLCRRNSTVTITPVSTVNIPVIQATTNSVSEIRVPSTLFTSAPNVASASRSTFNTRQVENVPPMVENIAPMLYNVENTSISALQAATTPAISSSNISVTAPILIRNEDFANTWSVPIVHHILMEQSIQQLLSNYSSQYKISKEDTAKQFRFVLSSVSQSRTDLAGRLLSYMKTREITKFNLKELLGHICKCCKAKLNVCTPPIGILKILVEITNEWNLLNTSGFLMTFARTVLLEWRRQHTATIARQTAANSQQQTATIAQQAAANTQKTRRASVIQNHNQPAQQGVPPQASIHMTTSAVESNQRQNSNQNLMNGLQENRFLRQCQEYSRLPNELAIMLARQQQHSQLLANTPAQNIQQQWRRRSSAEVQRQSIDSSNMPGDGLRRQAQQRPMVAGIQPPIAHTSSQASSVPQNHISALQQLLQQQISSISNHSVVPEQTVRANVSWKPNQNVVPAANASSSFAPPLPLTQQLRSVRRQPVSSEQPTQPPLMQPQTTRTFNPFPNDEFRLKLPLSQPLESTTAPHSITATSTWTPSAQVWNFAAPIANQASCATVGDCINAIIVKAVGATVEAAVKDESSEDIIDVDEWFEKMNDEMVCLNPEYFSQVHIKYDMDQLIKSDVNFDPLADNTENVEAQQQDPNPPRIASVDSGFSSPPRQFEHPEILSGERMCICS